MLHLPPNFPGSTPKKFEMVRNPNEGDLPDLEEMGHHELIDLVKKLLVERASKPTSLTNIRFNIRFEHVSGKANILVDMLSHLVDIDPDTRLDPENA